MPKLPIPSKATISSLISPLIGKTVPVLAPAGTGCYLPMVIAAPSRIEAGVPGLYRGVPDATWWSEYHREADLGLSGDVHRGSPGAPWWNEGSDGR